MNGFECLAWVVGKQVVAMTACNQIAELIVSAVHHSASKQAPFRDDYPFVGIIHTMICERIADDDVLAEQIAYAFHTFVLHIVSIESKIFIMEYLEKTLTAGRGIVRQQLNAIDATHGEHCVLFVFQLGVLALLHKATAYT